MKKWMTSVIMYMILCQILTNLMPDKSYEKYIKYMTGVVMIAVILFPIMKFDFNTIYEYGKEYEESMAIITDYYDLGIEEMIREDKYDGIYDISLSELKDESGNVIYVTAEVYCDKEVTENNIKKIISQFYNLDMQSIYVVRQVR